MAKVGGMKLNKRGSDSVGQHQVKGGPANGKGGAKIKTGGMGKKRMGNKASGC